MKRDVQGQTELRVKVAELCGWTEIEDCTCKMVPRGIGPGSANNAWKRHIPDYLNDLNACHGFEKALGTQSKELYAARLYCVATGKDFERLKSETGGGRRFSISAWMASVLIRATAEQRCRAFIATLEGSPVPDAPENHLAPPGSPKPRVR